MHSLETLLQSSNFDHLSRPAICVTMFSGGAGKWQLPASPHDCKKTLTNILYPDNHCFSLSAQDSINKVR